MQGIFQKENTDKSLKYGIYRHLPTYEKIIRNLVSFYPFYRNTDFEYYAPCENGFNVMLEELKKAEKYIFMEYFIVEEGFMFNSILSILEEKVKQGVEVRIMYDDMGSFQVHFPLLMPNN